MSFTRGKQGIKCNRYAKIGNEKNFRRWKKFCLKAGQIQHEEYSTHNYRAEVKALPSCPLPEKLLRTESLLRKPGKSFWPEVLILHTGGTLGMDKQKSYVVNETDPLSSVELVQGSGGEYIQIESLQPGEMLADIVSEIPELRSFASYDTKIVYNRDSCRMGPDEWRTLALELHNARSKYDAFVIIHGTDTLAYTAAALSLMLTGFGKPIVMTGSQLPLNFPRSDAKQNLIDAISCAVARSNSNIHKPMLAELGVCFGGWLMRGNRVQKDHTSRYKAFSSPTLPPLAEIGVDINWATSLLLREEQMVYQPRFSLDPRVVRITVVPGSDPRVVYGDLTKRGVKGCVLESFGVGNIPDTDEAGWLSWLSEQRQNGLNIFMTTQCRNGNLKPELYRSGAAALRMGIKYCPTPITIECAMVKMMMSLCYSDIVIDKPLSGEM